MNGVSELRLFQVAQTRSVAPLRHALFGFCEALRLRGDAVDDIITAAGEALAKHGLKFFYHVHGYEFQPYQNGTLLDLLVIGTNPKFVNFQMDVFWIVFPGQDPVQLLKKYGNRWQLMHVKGMREGTPTGLLTGHTDVTNDAAVGVGKINFPPILKAAKKAGVRELFSAFYRKRTFVVWALWGTAYFVANGLNNWMPSLYKTVYHLPLGQALRLASMSNVLSVIFVLVCAFLVDRVGRRRWVMSSFSIAGVLLAALYFSGAPSAYGVMLLGSTAYAVIGTTTILLFLYTPEIYPTRMRAVGTALATSWFRAASAAGPAIVGVVLGSEGVAPVFLMFAGVCVLGLLAALGMTETRQKSLEEIAP